jgi:hypothetical protein
LYLLEFGITTSGLNDPEKWGIAYAAILTGRKLLSYLSRETYTIQTAFLSAHGNVEINLGSGLGPAGSDNCSTVGGSISCDSAMDIGNAIHEFGHVFDNHYQSIFGHFAADYLPATYSETESGYMDDDYPSLQHPNRDFGDGTRGRYEDFADMYLNWVLDTNLAFPQNGFTTDTWGNTRRDWMNTDNIDTSYPIGIPTFLRNLGLR